MDSQRDGLWNLVTDDIWKVGEVKLTPSHEVQLIGSQRVLPMRWQTWVSNARR